VSGDNKEVLAHQMKARQAITYQILIVK